MLLGGQNNAPGPGDVDNSYEATAYCLIKNTGESVLAKHSVQLFGAATINPDPAVLADNDFAVQAGPAFAGVAPSSGAGDLTTIPFAITNGPIIANGFGLAAVAGLAVVQIQFAAKTDTRAFPLAGQTGYLVSGTSGGVPIVSSNIGTATGPGPWTVWGQVLLSPSAPLPSPPPPSCSGPGFLAGAMFCDSWTLTIVSQVGNMASMPANSPLCMKWDGTGWTSTTQLVTCLGSGFVTLSRGADGDPKLVYTPSGSGSGGSSYTFTFDCAIASTNTLYFVGGNSGTFAMCCAPAVAGGPAANNFRVAVQWSASCDTGVGAPCCPGVTIPPQLCVNITDMSGGHLSAWAGSYLLNYNGSGWVGTAVLPSGNTVAFTFGCSSPSGTLQLAVGVATRGNLSTGYVTYQQFAGSGPTTNCAGPTYLSGTVHSLPTNTETDGGYYLANMSVSAVTPSSACAQSAPPALCPDIASHPPLTLTFGANSGTLTWTGTAWTGTVAGFGYTLSLVAGYTWQLTGPVDTYTALSVGCGPFSAIFGPIGMPTYTVTGP